MSPQEIERKVKQLDNDTQAIYEMLNGIRALQRRHSNRFTEVDRRLETIDGRLADLGTSMTEVLRRLPG